MMAVGAQAHRVAAQGTAEAPGVAGIWHVTLKGTPHGDMTATMALEQKGTTVSGPLSAHGNDHALEGSFSGGALELAATDMPADQRILLSAKLQPDGSLAGSLSGPVGDVRWTATRTKDGK
jgi:hypothetical protein